MKSPILLLVTLTVCFRLVFSLDCTNAPGISFIPCQNPSASSTRGSGGTGAASSQDNTIAVQPCTDIQYNGGTPQKYTVTNQAVPQVFEFLFETLNIPDGEKLLIKTFKCDPDNECKIAVIDSTAATPVSVYINKYSFTLASQSSSFSATFKVNYDCTPVNGGWSNWGPWTSCNENCKQERIRTCDNPPPSNGGQDCIGSLTQIQDCTGGLCVQDCDGFTTLAGNKRLKDQEDTMTFQECFDVCETADSRMVKVTTIDESVAVIAAFTGSWLGVQQIAHNKYIWNDNTTFTVTLADGKIPEYGSINPWYYKTYTSKWDLDSYDNRNCLIAGFFGWSDVACDAKHICVCECTPPS